MGVVRTKPRSLSPVNSDAWRPRVSNSTGVASWDARSKADGCDAVDGDAAGTAVGGRRRRRRRDDDERERAEPGVAGVVGIEAVK